MDTAMNNSSIYSYSSYSPRPFKTFKKFRKAFESLVTMEQEKERNDAVSPSDEGIYYGRESCVSS